MANNIEVVEQNHMRRMPVEDAWLNHGVDSLIYSYMVNIASARPIEGGTGRELYLKFKKFNTHRATIRKLCDISVDTLRRRVDRLIEQGYIIKNKEEEIFLFPPNRTQPYILINNETLFFLVSTSNSFIIKLYVYLGYKWNWKKFHHESTYEFTLGELMDMLGYAGRNAMAEKREGMGLAALKQEGFINFEKRYVKGETHVREIFILTGFDGQNKLPKALREGVLMMIGEEQLDELTFDNIDRNLLPLMR